MDESDFAAFYEVAEPRLRRAFTALYGFDVGPDVAAEALTRAWRDWARVSTMANPVGYLFRVGQSRRRALTRRLRGPASLDHAPEPDTPMEASLAAAVRALPTRQRLAVVLTDVFAYSLAETAELMGISKSTAQVHRERGLVALRNMLIDKMEVVP